MLHATSSTRTHRAAPSLSARRPRRAVRGLTLIELMVVLGIVGVLLAMGGTTYWRLAQRQKDQGQAAELDMLIRQVRNSAVSANAPAGLDFHTDPDTRRTTVTPWVYRLVGNWHFEDGTDSQELKGPFHRAFRHGAVSFPEGRIGKCVRLRESDHVDLGNDPDFDLEDGGLLEAYIYPLVHSFSGEHYIFSKEGCYQLLIERGGALSGSVGGKAVKVQGYKIASERWTKVAMMWDRKTVRLFIDDGLAGIGETGNIRISSSPLMIGASNGSFNGLVDEVRILSATRAAPLKLDPRFTFTHTCAPWQGLYLSPDGSLDTRFHAGPASLSLIKDNKVRTVTVSMLGLTQRLEVENAEETPDSGGPKAARAKSPAEAEVKESNPDAERKSYSGPSMFRATKEGTQAPKFEPAPAKPGTGEPAERKEDGAK